ncbi:unnamed protein product [Prunus armeniaca]|uniref:Uncharacterized protein n=1 Tax=Prunus armeniaca TaxID=36596 RepID=A0A6J5X6C9_PRUAR|nr:unnamed protein product [Prunus armeniaca]
MASSASSCLVTTPTSTSNENQTGNTNHPPTYTPLISNGLDTVKPSNAEALPQETKANDSTPIEEDKASEMTSKVRSKLNEVYDQYKLLYQENVVHKDETHNPSEMEIDSNEVDFATAFTTGFMKLVEKTDGEESKTEVDSTGSHILDPFWSSLSPRTVEMKWKKLNQEWM